MRRILTVALLLAAPAIAAAGDKDRERRTRSAFAFTNATEATNKIQQDSTGFKKIQQDLTTFNNFQPLTTGRRSRRAAYDNCTTGT